MENDFQILVQQVTELESCWKKFFNEIEKANNVGTAISQLNSNIEHLVAEVTNSDLITCFAKDSTSVDDNKGMVLCSETDNSSSKQNLSSLKEASAGNKLDKNAEMIEFVNSLRTQTMKHIHNFKNDQKESLDLMKDELQKLLGVVVDFQNTSSNIQRAVKCVQENAVISLEDRNSDLLNDMQEMNFELKNRGEIISDLEKQLTEERTAREQVAVELSKCSEELNQSKNRVKKLECETADLQRKFEEVEKVAQEEVNELRSAVNNLEALVNEKNAAISSLESEAARNKDSQDGDTSSVGIMSKTEEQARLRDVDDVIEERYNKLRTLALKMKKRINDMNMQFEEERKHLNSEKAELQGKLMQLAPKAKLCQTLQMECDKLNDVLEGRESEIKGLKKLIAEQEKSLDILNTRIAALSAELSDSKLTYETLLEGKNHLDLSLKTARTELDALCKEKAANEVIRKETEKEISALKQKLKECESRIQSLVVELSQQKSEARQQEALMMEIREYEGTVADLRSQLLREKNSNEGLSRQINMIADANSKLVKQMKQLEESLNLAEETKEKMQVQVLSLNKSLSQYEMELTEQKDAVRSFKEKLQKEIFEKDKALAALAEASRSLQQLDVLSQCSKRKEEQMMQQVNSLKTELDNYREQVALKDEEMKRTVQDFENYKIRVQNAFQKQKSENNSKNIETKLKEQLSALTVETTELKEKLNFSQIELESCRTRLKELELEQETIGKKNTELAASLKLKVKELESVRTEFQEYRLQAESQIKSAMLDAEKAEMYEKQLRDTKQRLDDISSQYEQLQAAMAAKMSDKVNQKSDRNSVGAVESLRKISQSSLRSEYHSKTSMVPFEQLLAGDNSKDENAKISEESVKEQLKQYKTKINHLMRLLNEAEISIARNENLVTVLKTEIRRLEKLAECSTHMQNSEYVKNVFLKFLTLPSSDERSRLVPVLQMILKLDQEETKQLLTMAGGHDEGWSSWSSLLKWK